jgi:asparagine synthase (glutamine-hydrolysing)
LEETVWHAETLGHNAHGVARYLQSKAVHDQGYKVVLSGDGADELFAGYIYSRLDHILSNTDGLDEQTKNSRLEELLQKNPAFRNVLHASRPLTSTKTCHSLFGYAPSWIQAMELSRQPLKAIFQPSFLHQFSQFDAVKGMLAYVDVEGQLSDRTPVHQGMYTWIKSILPNQILFADRLEMAHGVEVRIPLLDHHVFDVIRRMPVHLLIYGMQEKYALREAARPFVTDKVYKRPKQPFTAPHSTLDPSNPFYELIQDTLRSKMLENIPFISPAAIRALLDSIPKMDYRSRITLDPVLLLLVSTCMIQKLYVSSESTSMMK